MAIEGKLFGSIGTSFPAAAGATQATLPGYAGWYAHRMAQSYEARRRRASLAELRLCELPLAA